ncbi:TonB-dependent receptor [Acinetobacter baumannii]|uniref:TonB-dependent receptor n=1 Tax=Acinetobacter baumannii TaxID=470 RepID=UPI0032F8B354|nr:TonB-dependent receptor [Acinetobacter baumannii]
MKKKYNVRSQATPKIGKTILKLSTLSLSMMCLTMTQAAETEQSSTDEKPTKVVKVAVTGSSIKGVAAQSASPITIIKGEDLANAGVTTVEEALTRVSSNQAGFSTDQNVGASNTDGSTANLRGLGSDKTLVLLNGRRLAANPFGTSTVNLNIIPLAMIDRIEVLRDGASAVYGADAVAGVINFITKKTYQGVGISAGLLQPEHKGGDKQDISIFGGYGDLDEDGYNIFGVVDYRRTNGIMAKDRRISERGGVLPELGLDGRSANAFTSNFYDPISGVSGNPYAQNGQCLGPAESAEEGFCYANTQALIGIKPDIENVSVLGRGTFKVNDNLNAIGEYIYSRSEVITSVAPDPFSRSNLSTRVTLSSDSPYYPGNGIVPSVKGLSGAPLELYLRSHAGNRIAKSINESHRLFAGLEGDVWGWDLNTGVTYAKSEASDNFVTGQLNKTKLQDALNNGTLNPFGESSDPNIWNNLSVKGKYNEATLESTTADFSISRPIFTLPAGEVGFALGGSFTNQDWKQHINADLVRQAPSSGTDPSKPDNSGDRDITSAFAELQIPITKTIEAQLAARYDDYSDFGDTFNPKFAIRWEPLKQLMFRTSYSTGFRAPSLYEINAAQSKTYTGAKYNDPLYCPGGVVVEGKNKNDFCNTQFMKLQGGSKDLQPEESKSFTAGFVFEPIKNLVLTVDYFNIKIDDLIAQVGEATIFGEPEKYSALFVRNADGTIDYIKTNLFNSGGMKTEGFDISLNYLTPMTSTGRFGFGIDGTYVAKLDYRDSKGEPWTGQVGLYEDPAVVRWKHTANINWAYENWKLVFEQQFVRGYDDQNQIGEEQYDHHKVSDYTLYNISGTYKGFKNLELTAGIKNIFDEDPSASNVLDNFQYGYDPRYGDPTGRTYYLRGTYKF